MRAKVLNGVKNEAVDQLAKGVCVVNLFLLEPRVILEHAIMLAIVLQWLN